MCSRLARERVTAVLDRSSALGGVRSRRPHRGFDQLVEDLDALAEESGLLAGGNPTEIRRIEHPSRGASVEEYARFGLAVMIPLAQIAKRERMPMVLDY